QRVGEGEGTVDAQRLAGDLVRPAREVAQAVDDHRQVDVARLEDRLAVVQGLEAGELVDALFQGVGHPPQDDAALATTHRTPGPRERLAGRSHRGVDVGSRGRTDLTQGLLGRGVL